MTCLETGHRHSDECPASLATYCDRIAELDRTINALRERRADVAAPLETAAGRTFGQQPVRATGAGSEEPRSSSAPDDAVAGQLVVGQLVGRQLPPLVLPAGEKRWVELGALGTGRTVSTCTR